jgi:hypothetical protein
VGQVKLSQEVFVHLEDHSGGLMLRIERMEGVYISLHNPNVAKILELFQVSKQFCFMVGVTRMFRQLEMLG